MRLLCLLLVSLLLPACGGDDDPPASPDAGTPDAGPLPMDSGSPDAGWICGNGRRDGAETCDDGNRVTEACDYGQMACMVCDEGCRQTAGDVFYCGDGALQPGEGETCDDGEANSNGWAPTEHCNGSCDGVGRWCGDGVVDLEEECEGTSTCALGGACAGGCACAYAPCATVTAPAVVGSLGLGAAILELHLVGSTIHAVTSDGTLRIIDVSDPTTPAEVGTFDPGWTLQNVWASRTRAYLVGSGLAVIDVLDPTMPTLLGVGLGDVGYRSIAVSFPRAYLGDDAGAFAIANVSNPRAPAMSALESGLTSLVTKLVVSGGMVYAVTNDGAGATATSGLRTIDVSDPTSPVVVGSYDTPGDPRGLAIAGSHAYIADGAGAGLTVVDISTPTSPAGVGFRTLATGAANDVSLAGDFAVLATTTEGLVVLDVGDPTSPGLAASLPLPSAFTVEARGRFAFVGHADNTLRVVRLCADP